MSWENIIKNRQAKNPVEFSHELLEEIFYERMKLNEEEQEIDDMNFPFDFEFYEELRKKFENLIARIYEAIDNYYEEEFEERLQ